MCLYMLVCDHCGFIVLLSTLRNICLGKSHILISDDWCALMLRLGGRRRCCRWELFSLLLNLRPAVLLFMFWSSDRLEHPRDAGRSWCWVSRGCWGRRR